LLFVKSFILRIKPTYTYPMFIVATTVGNTEVAVTDGVEYSGTLLLFDGACTGLTTMGMATMWDQPRASYGGWRSQYDTGTDPTIIPVYPAGQEVQWGFDKKYLCPEDFIEGSVCITWAGGIPTYDSILAFDTPIFQSGAYFYEALGITFVPLAGLQIGELLTVGTGTLTYLILTINGGPDAGPADFNLVGKHNGSTYGTWGVTVTSFPFVLSVAVTLSMTAGDTLGFDIVPTDGTNAIVDWASVTVEVGVATAWSFDTDLAAGSYCVYKAL
jgi:hypothetical protein